VSVGSLFFDLGYLEYVHTAATADAGTPASGWWPIIVGIGGGVLVVFIVVLVFVFVRKSSYNERLYRRLQGQLDALESSVRNECKQGSHVLSFVHSFFLFTNMLIISPHHLHFISHTPAHHLIQHLFHHLSLIHRLKHTFSQNSFFPSRATMINDNY